ncbi:RNA-directed DNA polymerase, eukaryota [Tanacetum coccineum]
MDPLSQFLFIIVDEALHVALYEAELNNIFKGISIGRDLTVSHLQYADDIIFVSDWSLENAKNLIRILKCFHIASGLKINLTKSAIYGVGVNASEVEHAPLKVLAHLESLRRTFFWGGSNEEKKITWIAWNTILASKKRWSRGHESMDRYIKSWAHNSAAQYSFVSSFYRKLKSGGATKFWSNVWIGSHILMMAFPRLFALEPNKDALVKDRLSIAGEFSWQWRRDPRGGREAEQLRLLLDILRKIQLMEGLDEWRWMLDPMDVFNVADARGIDLHSTLCSMCNEVPEDADHAFCGCMNAKKLWSEVLDWWMLNVTPPQSVNELPLIWNLSSLGVAQQELLEVMAHLGKKWTILQLYTKVEEEKRTDSTNGITNYSTTSEGLKDDVRIIVTVSKRNWLKEALEDSSGR